jgi:hypothetical protein
LLVSDIGKGVIEFSSTTDYVSVEISDEGGKSKASN